MACGFAEKKSVIKDFAKLKRLLLLAGFWMLMPGPAVAAAADWQALEREIEIQPLSLAPPDSARPRRADSRAKGAEHSGYIADVSAEPRQDPQTVFLVLPPAPSGPPILDRIFDAKLTREFRDRYEQQFGKTEIERIYNNPNRFTYYSDLASLRPNVIAEDGQRRQFGEYMLRRLVEYHVENYAKNDPTVRPVWEAKERISNVKIEVQKFRFDVQYSLTGNFVDVKVNNPYAPGKITLQMDPTKVGPTPVNETVVSVGRNVWQDLHLATNWRVNDGVMSWVGIKNIFNGVTTSLTVTFNTNASGASPRGRAYLFGAGWGF